MNYKREYIKQFDSGIVGHIYEHVVADKLSALLLAKGYFRLLDYELSANTYDGIIVFGVETRHRAVINTLTRMLKNENYTSEEINNATLQISGEYGRLAKFNQKKLKKAIAESTTVAWQEVKDFPISRPIKKDEQRSLKSKAGEYSRYSPKSFDVYDFVYKINDCPYELRTLAVYLLQIIGLVQVDLLYNSIKNCYDYGDEWAQYQDLVGYSHRLILPKSSKISYSDLETLSANNLEIVFSAKVVSKMVKYIARQSKSNYPYFSTDSLFANSYQILGKRTFQRLVTKSNIEKLIHLLNVAIDYV